VRFLSRRWGQDSPAKTPTKILSLRQLLQDLSVELAIGLIDRMGAVSTAHAYSLAGMREFFRQILYSLPSWNSALPFWFQYFFPRGRDLDLDCNASWVFRIPISFKIQAGVFLEFADLEKYAYASILMIGHRRFAVKQTMDFIHALFTLTACTVSHLWIRLVPSPTTAQLESEQAVHISDDSCDVDKGINAALNPLHELVVLSQPFSKAAAEVSTSESEWSDGFR